MQTAEDITLLDESAMRRALSRIAYEIVEHVDDVGKLAIVGVRTRGWFLAQRIAQRLTEMESRPVPHYALDVSPYRDDRSANVDVKNEESDCRLPQVKPTPDNSIAHMVDKKSVVLVDDVLFTGRTVRAALDALTNGGRPEWIQLAVLVDRGHRELPIRPDYVGKNIPTSRLERVQVCVRELDGLDAVRLRKPVRAGGQ